MRKLVGALLFSAMALAVPSQAAAATITLDFAAALYSGAHNQNSFSTTDQGIGVNLQASESSIFATSSTLNYLAEGIGVNSRFDTIFGDLNPDDTEVGLDEMLTVSFTSAQFVESFSLKLLFNNQQEHEEGSYSINGGAFQSFTAIDASGNLTVVVGQAGVNDIRFRVPSFSDGGKVDDYAVKSINVTTVPEPASMMLLGTGLLYAARRRHQMKKKE